MGTVHVGLKILVTFGIVLLVLEKKEPVYFCKRGSFEMVKDQISWSHIQSQINVLNTHYDKNVHMFLWHFFMREDICYESEASKCFWWSGQSCAWQLCYHQCMIRCECEWDYDYKTFWA